MTRSYLQDMSLMPARWCIDPAIALPPECALALSNLTQHLSLADLAGRIA